MKKLPPQDEYLSSKQAAEELGITMRRVQVFLNEGRLKGARKLGREWMIPRSALAGLKVAKTGRPKKL